MRSGALLEALDLTVVIKSGRGGPRFKPELIEFAWAGNFTVDANDTLVVRGDRPD